MVPGEHLEQEAEPCTEYVPAGQIEQDDEPLKEEYCPAGQAEHKVEPSNTL
jgi:hypothetical protein